MTQQARLLRDGHGNHCIEVLRGTKYAHIIIRESMMLETGRRLVTQCRKVRLKALRARDTYGGNDVVIDDAFPRGRPINFDDRWSYVDPKDYPLAKAIEHFRNPKMGGKVTARADQVLRALLSNKVVTEDIMTEDNEQPSEDNLSKDTNTTTTVEGEVNVSKKAKKSKKSSGKKNGVKRNGACAKVWEIAAANKSLSRKEVIEKCVKAGVNKSTASTQYQKYMHRNDK